MTGLALALVLAAAFAHATWNFLAKKASGGVQFIWLFGGFASILYAPAAIGILVVQKPQMAWANVGLMLASAAVHAIYFTLLDLGYRVGDLSVVYPIARGTAPLLSVTVGVLFLNERPSLVALGGILLMAVGIFIVSGFRMSSGGDRAREADLRMPAGGDGPLEAGVPMPPGRGDAHGFGAPGGGDAHGSGAPASGERRDVRKAVLVALGCGAAIATYTVLDKISVSVLKTPPLVLDWATNFGRFLLITPFALRSRDRIKVEWRLHRGYAAGVAVLSSLAYILVLIAMTFTPVSYIAPAREISILVGAAMGAKFLAEENAKSRVVGTAAMVAGLVALALG